MKTCTVSLKTLLLASLQNLFQFSNVWSDNSVPSYGTSAIAPPYVRVPEPYTLKISNKKDLTYRDLFIELTYLVKHRNQFTTVIQDPALSTEEQYLATKLLNTLDKISIHVDSKLADAVKSSNPYDTSLPINQICSFTQIDGLDDYLINQITEGFFKYKSDRSKDSHIGKVMAFLDTQFRTLDVVYSSFAKPSMEKYWDRFKYIDFNGPFKYNEFIHMHLKEFKLIYPDINLPDKFEALSEEEIVRKCVMKPVGITLAPLTKGTYDCLMEMGVEPIGVLKNNHAFSNLYTFNNFSRASYFLDLSYVVSKSRFSHIGWKENCSRTYIDLFTIGNQTRENSGFTLDSNDLVIVRRALSNSDVNPVRDDATILTYEVAGMSVGDRLKHLKDKFQYLRYDLVTNLFFTILDQPDKYVPGYRPKGVLALHVIEMFLYRHASFFEKIHHFKGQDIHGHTLLQVILEQIYSAVSYAVINVFVCALEIIAYDQAVIEQCAENRSFEGFYECFKRAEDDPYLSRYTDIIHDHLTSINENMVDMLNHLLHNGVNEHSLDKYIDDAIVLSIKIKKESTYSDEKMFIEIDPKDGYQLTNIQMLDEESKRMSHCVGHGGYDRHITKNTGLFFHLNVPSEKSGVTLFLMKEIALPTSRHFSLPSETRDESSIGDYFSISSYKGFNNRSNDEVIVEKYVYDFIVKYFKIGDEHKLRMTGYYYSLREYQVPFHATEFGEGINGFAEHIQRNA